MELSKRKDLALSSLRLVNLEVELTALRHELEG